MLLVGGATRMPGIRRLVRNMTGLEPRPEIVDADAAVATGAAIYAGVLSGHIKDLMVMDVWQAAMMRALATDALTHDAALRRRMLGEDSADFLEDVRANGGGASGDEAARTLDTPRQAGSDDGDVVEQAPSGDADGDWPVAAAAGRAPPSAQPARQAVA